jgi:hypothetical protein
MPEDQDGGRKFECLREQAEHLIKKLRIRLPGRALNRSILLKSSFTVFIAPEWFHQYQSAKQKTIETGEKQSVELQLQTGVQELKWVLVGWI